MKIGLISFTEKGQILGDRIRENLCKEGHEVLAFTKSKFSKGLKETNYLDKTLDDWTRNMFQQVQGIVFIGACAIAVRSIAPYIKDKTKDPAVVVVDEGGKFCISLLAGHIGGANELAKEIGERIEAIPVITTATDLNQRFAVDMFSKKNRLEISNMVYAKEISAALLAGKRVGIFGECKLPVTLPEGLEVPDKKIISSIGIYIGIRREKTPFSPTLYLTPKVITLGIGCKKNSEIEVIEHLVERLCKENSIDKKAIKQAASIKLKENEPGIIEYCKKYKLPFICYSNEELQKVQGEFSPSRFVESVTGVDNVCERSAVLGSRQGKLIVKKTAQNGVTAAMAVEEWSVNFE